MKRIYVVIPLLGLTAFAGYYHHWSATHDAAVCKGPGEPEPVVSWSMEDSFDEDEHRDGRRDAENDIINGRPRMLTYGYPVHWISEYAEVLKRDYNVELHAVAGCCVTEPLLKYVADYNQVIDDYLKKIYGNDYSKEAVAKAEALHAVRNFSPEPPATKSP